MPIKLQHTHYVQLGCSRHSFMAVFLGVVHYDVLTSDKERSVGPLFGSLSFLCSERCSLQQWFIFTLHIRPAPFVQVVGTSTIQYTMYRDDQIVKLTIIDSKMNHYRHWLCCSCMTLNVKSLPRDIATFQTSLSLLYIYSAIINIAATQQQVTCIMYLEGQYGLNHHRLRGYDG